MMRFLGQYGDPVLVALAFAYQYFAALEFDVLHAQAQGFEDPHAGTVEQRRHEPHRAVELVQHVPHFTFPEDDRQSPRDSGRGNVPQPRQIDIQHRPCRGTAGLP